MPTYKFTAPNGKTVRVTGDTPPSESEIDQIFKEAGVDSDVGASTTVPEAPSLQQLASAKTPAERIAALKDTPVGGDLQKVLSLARLWATNGPHAVVQGIKDFMGGDLAKGAHEAISGAGITALPMVAGPMLAAAAGAPVTAGLTVAGGYAGGKLSSLAAGAMGANEDQTALAGDVGMLAGGAAGGRLLSMPGKAVAKGALNATAAALDNPVTGAISPRARNIGELAGKLADAIKKNPQAAESAGVHLDLSQRVPAGSLTQQQIGERLAAARAQGMTAPPVEPVKNPAQPVRVPLPKPIPVVQSNAPTDIISGDILRVPRPEPQPINGQWRSPVPPGPPEPSVTAEPFNAPRVKPPSPKELSEQALSEHRAIVTAAREANVSLQPGDRDALVKVVRSGVPVKDAVEALKATRVPEDPAAELARRFNLPSDAERTFPPNKSGLPTKPPTARKARGKIADLADMPVTKAEPVIEPTPAQNQYASVADTGKISDLAAPEATPAAPAKKVRVPKAKVDAPAEAAAQVKQQVKRVVDVNGVKTGAEVQRRVLSTLQSELESAEQAAGFKTVEFQRLGTAGGQVKIDGKVVAKTNKYGDSKWFYPEDEALKNTPISSSEFRSPMPSELAKHAEHAVSAAYGRARGAGQIVIDIPGDGTFTIERNPHAIQAVMKRIAAAPGGTWGGVGSVKNAPPSVGPWIPKATW